MNTQSPYPMLSPDTSSVPAPSTDPVLWLRPALTGPESGDYEREWQAIHRTLVRAFASRGARDAEELASRTWTRMVEKLAVDGRWRVLLTDPPAEKPENLFLLRRLPRILLELVMTPGQPLPRIEARFAEDSHALARQTVEAALDARDQLHARISVEPSILQHESHYLLEAGPTDGARLWAAAVRVVKHETDQQRVQYLLGVARNVHREQYHERAHEPLPDDDRGCAFEAAAGGPLDVLVEEVRQEVFRSALERLEERQRRVLLDHAVRNRSFAEIARALGLSEANCRQIAARARSALRAWVVRDPRWSDAPRGGRK